MDISLLMEAGLLAVSAALVLARKWKWLIGLWVVVSAFVIAVYLITPEN